MNNQTRPMWRIDIKEAGGTWPLRYPNGKIKRFRSRQRAEAWAATALVGPFRGRGIVVPC